MEKKIKKDRILAISAAIIVAILAVIIILTLFVPIWEAKLRLSSVEDVFESFSSPDVIIVADPLFIGVGLQNGAEVILEGDEADAVAEGVLSVIDSAKYSETKKTLVTGLNMNVSLRSEEGSFFVYFLEEEFYLLNGEKQYVFLPDEDHIADYRNFIAEIDKMLAQSEEK